MSKEFIFTEDKPMTREDMNEYLASLSNDDLLRKLREAGADLELAATTQRDSDWHSECFAAAVVYSQEAGRRRILVPYNVANKGIAPGND